MNKKYIMYNLKEALTELNNMIYDIEKNDGYEIGNLAVAMEHLYHHVNTAWNARNSTDDESTICSQSDFDKWRQFPSDIEMSA